MTELNKERGGGRGRTTSILNVRLPTADFDAFVGEAGEKYGGRSELFRKMFAYWREGDEVRALKEKLRIANQRMMRAERKLAEIDKLLHQ